MDAIARFIATGGFADGTTKCYERILRLIETDYNTEYLGADDLRLWLQSRGWGNATQWMALCAIKSFLRWSYGDGHPALRLRIKRLDSPPQRVLDVKMIIRLLESFDTSSPKGRRDLAICAMMLDSGLRSAEICSLELRHIDLENRSLRVLVKGGKWSQGVFSDYTSACIASWLGDRDRIAAPGERTLFVGIGGATPGRRLTTGGLRPVMRGWAKSAGIGRLSPHDLRRTFATVAIRLGAPSRIVQVAGRWSRLEMVERYTRTIEAADMDPWFPVNRAMGET